MRQDKRGVVKGPPTPFVDEMYAGAVNLAAIMLKTIEERLLGAPVEPVSPIGDQLAQIGRAYPSVPIIGGVWWQPGDAKPQPEIFQN